MRSYVQITGIVVTALLTGTALAHDSAPLKSENFDLPVGDRQFTGPGSEVANNNCLTCHSAGMVTVQAPLSKEVWEGIVKKMIKVYKAPVADGDVAAIVDYLSNNPAASK
ncbi:MAG: cytochrome c [Proteobacteria bacterium]|nr:cytochrome c [Pseudomonadota bacterium]